MNKDFRTTEEKLERTGQHVRLSDIEKAHMRAQLIRVTQEPVPSPFWKYILHINIVRFGVVPLLIVFLVTGGVATASANTLPGDALYVVKTHVLEPVRGIAYRGEESVYQKQLAQRRLSELVEVSEQGSVKEDTQQTILDLFDTHRKKAEQEAREVSVGEQIAVQSELESELRAHERVFADLDKDDIREKLQSRITIVVQARVESESELAFSTGNLEPVVQKKKGEALGVIKKYQKELDASQGGQIALQTQVQIDLAQQALEEAEKSEEAGSFARAIVQYEKAKRFAGEAGRVFALKNRFAIAPTQVAIDKVELLEKKTKAPIPEVVIMAVSESLPNEDSVATTNAISTQNVYEYFQAVVSAKASSIGIPRMYLSAFPGMQARDFNGVIANGGIYNVQEGKVAFVPTIDTEDGTSPETIEYEGHIRLLINIATRLGTEISSIESVDLILRQLTQTEGAQTEPLKRVDTPVKVRNESLEEQEELELPIDL